MLSARAARRDRFRRTLKFSQTKHSFFPVCDHLLRMSCTLQPSENPRRESGMLQIHADVPASWMPISPAGAHSPVFTVHAFPRPTACRPGKFGKAVP